MSHEDDLMGQRKIRKVVVEKQRRDRIEQCFDQLRTILEQQHCRQRLLQRRSTLKPCAASRLEKAELLELTVDYVYRVQQDLIRQTALGFDICVEEVRRYLASNYRTSATKAEMKTSSLEDNSKNAYFDVEAWLLKELMTRLRRSADGVRRASALRPETVQDPDQRRCAEQSRQPFCLLPRRPPSCSSTPDFGKSAQAESVLKDTNGCRRKNYACSSSTSCKSTETVNCLETEALTRCRNETHLSPPIVTSTAITSPPPRKLQKLAADRPDTDFITSSDVRLPIAIPVRNARSVKGGASEAVDFKVKRNWKTGNDKTCGRLELSSVAEDRSGEISKCGLAWRPW